MTTWTREAEALDVTLATRFDGVHHTFSSRSEDTAPYDISYGTQNPGGFADASVTVARAPWSGADIPMFGDITIRGAGGDVRYKGRVKGAPKTDSEAVTLNAEGLAAHLDDNAFFRFLGCHNDVGAWGETPAQRQLDLIATLYSPLNEGGVVPSQTTPVLSTRLTPTTSAVSNEKWLRVDGIPIGRVKGRWEKTDPVKESDLDYSWIVGLSTDDHSIDAGVTGNLLAAGPGTYDLTATDTAYYALVSFGNSTGVTEVDGYVYDIYWLPTVVGDHGLTLHDLDDGSLRSGITIGDALTYCITNGAPELDIFSIEDADYVLSHLVHTGTVREVVEQVSAFGSVNGRVPDWGVYENGFFWGAPGSFGRTWRVNRSQMAVATDEGPSADQMTQAVVITFTDGAGQTLSVGPPGTDADFGSTSLASDNPNNTSPAYSVLVRDVGLTTLEGATLIGEALLAETNNNPNKGTVTITGDLEDEAGNIGHASEVRACDRVVVINDETPTEQDIVSTSYDHGSLTVTANIGLAPANIETLLARLAASVSGL